MGFWEHDEMVEIRNELRRANGENIPPYEERRKAKRRFFIIIGGIFVFLGITAPLAEAIVGKNLFLLCVAYLVIIGIIAFVIHILPEDWKNTLR